MHEYTKWYLWMVGFLNSILIVKPALLFLDTQVSLAPTHVSKLVSPLVGLLVTLSDFQSLVALRDKLKREDPNYFLTQKLFWPKIFFDPKTFLTQKFFLTQKTFLDPKTFLTQKLFWSKNFFDPKKFLTQKLFWPNNFFDPNFFFWPNKLF